MRLVSKGLSVALSVVLCSIAAVSTVRAQENIYIPKSSVDVRTPGSQLRPLVKDGKPYFPIGAYGFPIGCTASELRDAGWNMVLLNYNDPETKQRLADCEKAGVGVMLHIGVPVYSMKQDVVRGLINEYKHYPAIRGYYIADEPENFFDSEGYKKAAAARPGLSPEDYAKECLGFAKKLVKELDPDRYTFMCIAWWTSYGKLQEICDVNMPNSYPTNNTKNEFEGDQAEIVYDAKLAAAAAREHGGLGFIYTVFGLDNNQGCETYRPPTIREFRYSVYSAITAGSMGIFDWAAYRSSKGYAQKIIFPVTRELRTLSPFFLGKWLDSDLTCEPSDSSTKLLKEYSLPTVGGCLRRAADGRYLLLAVNNTNRPVNAKLTLHMKNLPASCWDFFGKSNASMNRGVITTKLPPYGVAAYVFSTKK